MFVKGVLRYMVVLVMVGLMGIAWAETAAGPHLGTWVLDGKDSSVWKATLVFTKQNGTKNEGYFKWLALNGEPCSAYERFEGIINPTSHLITLKGLDMQQRTGEIATGNIYEATVSADGYHLRNGRWFGQNVANGTWSAVWENDDMPKP